MNVQSIDLGHKLRQGVHFCLDLAPVIICRPIARERLNRLELYALGLIFNGLLFGPARRCDAGAQLLEVRLGSLNRERPYCWGGGWLCGCDRHVGLRLFWTVAA